LQALFHSKSDESFESAEGDSITIEPWGSVVSEWGYGWIQRLFRIQPEVERLSRTQSRFLAHFTHFNEIEISDLREKFQSLSKGAGKEGDRGGGRSGGEVGFQEIKGVFASFPDALVERLFQACFAFFLLRFLLVGASFL